MSSLRSARRGAAPTNASEKLHEQLGTVIDELVAAGVSLEQARNEFERQYLIRALTASGGGVARSAERLGIHRNTLRKKVCALGIKPTDYR